MRSLPKDATHRMKKKYNSFFLLILTLIAGCTWMVGCGQASSNNLPGRSDSSNQSEGSDSAGQSGVARAQTPASADTGKLGGTWFLVAVLPSDTAAGKIPTLNFDENSKNFSGSTGCNNMRGKFSFTDSTLKIDEQIITTKMACPGYNEDAFLKNLPKANGYRFENGMLVLLSDQTELSRWTREPVKPTTKTT
ncbi:META domain-containing protein [Flavitalea sp.]|nr:META domain-containing protein [Flavitalea sp.]